MSERLTPPIPGPPSVRHMGDSVTTGSLPTAETEEVGPRRVRKPLAGWLVLYAVLLAVLGVLGGVVWEAVVPLTTYRVDSEGLATTTERGLAGLVAGDAWFVIIGLVLGVVCGALTWSWFAGLGGPAVLVALVGATMMGLLCWGVGWLLGPGPLTERLAHARPGDTVPIELTVRGHAAVLVWPFAAALILMLLSSLLADPEQPRGENPDDPV